MSTQIFSIVTIGKVAFIYLFIYLVIYLYIYLFVCFELEVFHAKVLIVRHFMIISCLKIVLDCNSFIYVNRFVNRIEQKHVKPLSRRI